MKYHYVYLLTLWRGTSYIGVRSCKCSPENDSYYGSSKEFDDSNVMSKTILKTFTKRTTANNYEAWLHECYDVANNKAFANKMKATVGGFYYGQPHTPESRIKMSKSQTKRFKESIPPWTGVKKSDKEVAKMAARSREWHKTNDHPMLGKEHSPETKLKMSRSQTKRFETEDAWNKGKEATPETKKRMSEAQLKYLETNLHNWLGKKHTPEAKQKMSKALTGVKRTEEAVAIISEAFKIKNIYKVINNNTNEVYYGLYNDFVVNSKTVFNRGKTFVHKLMRKDLGVPRSGWTATIFIERKGPKSRMK